MPSGFPRVRLGETEKLSHLLLVLAETKAKNKLTTKTPPGGRPSSACRSFTELKYASEISYGLITNLSWRTCFSASMPRSRLAGSLRSMTSLNRSR